MTQRGDSANQRASKRALFDGIVSAASDNDPTTVATLAVTGASIVYALNWLLFLVVPMLMAVQAIGTQVAGITREGLLAAIRRRYGVVVAVIALLLTPPAGAASSSAPAPASA